MCIEELGSVVLANDPLENLRHRRSQGGLECSDQPTTEDLRAIGHGLCIRQKKSEGQWKW
jgi:hypothetical protein